MKTSTPFDFWKLAIIFSLVLYTSCGNRSLDLRYRYDAFEEVRDVAAYDGKAIVATAERIDERHVGDIGGATVTDVDVQETHFDPSTQAVVYKGRIVFRCLTNQEFCERITVTPLLGKRPRDIFRQWPYARTP